MPATALNNLGLNSGWALAEDGWKAGMDQNLVLIDSLAQAGAAGMLQNAPPGSPSAGQVIGVGTSPTGAFASHANAIAMYNAAAWTFVVPLTGWFIFDRSLGKWWIFDGTTWTDNVRKYFAHLVTATTASAKTLALADVETMMQLTDGTGVTLTIPTNATVAFPIGTEIQVVQAGAGQVTFTPATGVTLNANGGKTKTAAQHAVATLKKVATDTWRLYGDIST